MPSLLAQAFRDHLQRDPSAPVAWTPAGVRDRAALAAAAAGVERCLGAVAPGSRVAVSVRDAFGFLAAVLALASRGDAAVLLDAADPQAPRLDLAARFGAAFLLTDARGGEGPVVIAVPDAEPLPAGELRAIKLTSGSTELPRGIGVGDAELLADAAQLERTMGIAAGDRVLAAVPMSFSYGVGSLLVPALARGRTLVLPDATHPLGFLRALRHGEPTVLPAVPALLRALLQGGARAPASLRLVVSAGAVLPPEVAVACRTDFGRPVHVFYGSTESGGITFDPTGTAAERGCVGAPVDGVSVTIGGDGLVCVRSAAVGRALDGSDNPTNGCFTTCDLGRFDGGELVLLGRAGDVFDVGGHKVDPREVERLLLRLPGVTDAAVVPWRDADGRAIAAAIVAVAAAAVDEAMLRRELCWQLPAAKVPRLVAVVPRLPRNERGKLPRAEVERLLVAAANGTAGAAGAPQQPS
jgi:long-chain acyl-CoA synthetase